MKHLAIYLNDHLGGATGGLELARRAASSNRNNDYGPDLARLATEIEEDRDALTRLMDELDVGRDRIKVTGGWLAEKAGRLKLNGSLLSYSPLSRLIELEGLTIGVTGKRSLWANLAQVGPALTDRIDSVDLTDLRRRAENQLADLERLRLKAAAEALDV
jgi:hypothetical protein